MKCVPQSVLVSLTRDTEESEDSFGVSGILLSKDWVLTHGTLLLPIISKIQDFILTERKLEQGLVAIPDYFFNGYKFQLHANAKSDDEEGLRVFNWKTTEEKHCCLKLIWRCPLLRETFNEMLFSWSFEKVTKFDKSLLPIFLLLRVTNGEATFTKEDFVDAKAVLSDFYAKNFNNVDSAKCFPLRRGEIVEIESTPFGSPVFLNSVSRGIVSNVFGKQSCIILTDANALPGCEGAPLFTITEQDMQKRIRGIVIAPLSWCRDEWVDYTFAANLQVCLQKVLTTKCVSVINDLSAIQYSSKKSEQLLPDRLDRSVVVVKCSSGWGTGVVIDVPTRTILTCSHVVRESPGSRVSVTIFDDEEGERQTWARLIYRIRDGQPYDVAILKLENEHKNLRALKLASRAPSRGTKVMTIGFPFFNSGLASCSLGVISRATSCMLQTTCCVQSGTSGGPVVDITTGDMLGLIVSNTVSGSESRALYPRFNMAVPATILRQPLQNYIVTGDTKYLDRLSSTDPAVLQTWNFYLIPRSKF